MEERQKRAADSLKLPINTGSAAFDVSQHTAHIAPDGRPVDFAEWHAPPPSTSQLSPTSSSPLSSKQPTPKLKGWLVAGVAALLFVIGIAVAAVHYWPRSETVANGNIAAGQVAQTPFDQFVNAGQISIDGSKTLAINGQLKANNSLIISPTAQPTDAVAGQLYFDKSSNRLRYFNGTDFIDIGASTAPTAAVNTPPSAPVVGTGATDHDAPGVVSLQGQSGALSLIAGGGIAIDGTTISNSGLLSLGGQTGAVVVGNGLKAVNGTLSSTGVQSIIAGSPSLAVSNDGAGNITITSTGGGTGTVSSTGGTAGQLAYFTGAQTIADSLISQSGSTVTVGGNLAITGALNLSTPLTVASGGTGAASASGARTSLGAAAAGANSDITSLSGLTTALSVAQGGTGTTSLGANGVVVGNGTGALSSVAAGGANLCLLSTVGAPVWASCPGIASLDGLTGALTVANSTGSGSTITINSATTSQLGLASFNATNFTVSGGAVNTIQDINTTAAPTFGTLALASSQATNPMLLVNNTNIGASGNLIDLKLNGASKLSVAPTGNLSLTGTVNGQTISSTASFTGSVAVAGAANLNGGASVTGTLTANTITPTAALTIGSPSQSTTLQGSSASVITATSGASTTTIGFVAPTANVTYQFQTAATGTYGICSTAGNCVGLGGGVTTGGGTANTIAKFSGSQGIGNSGITDDGVTVGTSELLNQTYSGTNTTAATFGVTNGASSGTTSQKGVSINLSGTNNATGANTNTGLSFGNVTAATNNTFNAIAFGTGYNSLVSYNSTTLISGAGLIQNAAMDSTLTYSNIQKVGTLTVGSIASGFGAISTGNNISTTAVLQGGTGVFTGTNSLTLGTASTNTGSIIFNGSGSANTLTLKGPTAPSGTNVLTLPDENATVCTNAAIGTSTICTLQTMYNHSTGGSSTTPSITLAGTIGGLNIQDANTTSVGGNFMSLRASNGGNTGIQGAVVFGFGIQGQFFEKPTVDTTTAMQVENSAGNTLFAIDSSGKYINIGSTGGATGGTGSAYNGSTTNIENSPNANTTTNIGSTAQNSGTATINIGYTNTAGGGSAVNIGSGPSASSGTTIVQANTALTLNGSGSVAINNSINGNTTINGGTSTGTVGIGNAAAGALTLQSASTIGITTTNFNLSTLGVATLAGAQPADITTAATTTANGITILPGSSSAATVTGAGVTIQGGTVTGTTTVTAGSVTIQGGNATGASGTRNGGNVSVDAGTGATVNGTVNIGTNNAATIQIGQNGSPNPQVKIDSGTGSINIGTGAQARAINIGTGGAAQTVTLGSSSSTSQTIIQGGTSGILIGSTNTAQTIKIGDTSHAVAQTLTIGASNTAGATDTVTLGSQIGTSTTTIQGGTSGTGISLATGSGGAIGLTTSGAGQIKLTPGSSQVLIQPTTDSANAFQVQNASSVAVLTTDTTNERLIVGPAAGDTVGALLVLGNKTTTGDPTGTEGAMYYNNALKEFRCFANGNWGGCEVDQIESGFNITDDFINGGTGNKAIGNAGWTMNTFGSGTSVIDYNNGIAPTSDHPGILRVRANQATGSASSGMALTLGNSSAGSMALSASYDVKATAGVESATTGTQTFRIGLGNENTSTTAPTTGVWWEADPTQSANWRYCYVNATPSTVCTASGVAIAAGSLVRLQIHINALGTGTSSVTFTINGTATTVSSVTVNTTNLVYPDMVCYAQGTTEQDCDVDYYQASGTASALR